MSDKLSDLVQNAYFHSAPGSALLENRGWLYQLQTNRDRPARAHRYQKRETFSAINLNYRLYIQSCTPWLLAKSNAPESEVASQAEERLARIE